MLNRRDFVKLLGLSAVVAPVLPAVLKEKKVKDGIMTNILWAFAGIIWLGAMIHIGILIGAF